MLAYHSNRKTKPSTAQLRVEHSLKMVKRWSQFCTPLDFRELESFRILEAVSVDT